MYNGFISAKFSSWVLDRVVKLPYVGMTMGRLDMIIQKQEVLFGRIPFN